MKEVKERRNNDNTREQYGFSFDFQRNSRVRD
jgi:hypothetical protein